MDDNDNFDGDETAPAATSSVVDKALGELRQLAAAFPDLLEDGIADTEARHGDDPLLKARINAYRRVMEFNRAGGADFDAASPSDALLELDELQHGAVRFDVARAALKAYFKRFGRVPGLVNLEPLLCGPGTSREKWRDDRRSDLQIIPRQGAQTTIVAFCDFKHTFNMPVNTFYHGWLSAYPANVVILRDWKRLLYLLGVASVGTMDQTLVELRRVLQSLGTRKLVTAGNSAGGLAALQYGILLDARRVLSFAAPVDLSYGVTYVSERMRTRLLRNQSKWPNIRQMLEPRPEIKADVFYGRANEVDRTHAERLTGLSNAALYPIDDEASHGLLRTLAVRGELDAAFRKAIEGA